MARKEQVKVKARTKVILGLLALGVSGWMLTAQDSGNTGSNDKGKGLRGLEDPVDLEVRGIIDPGQDLCLLHWIRTMTE